MINVLADKYLYKIDEFLPDVINLSLFDPQKPLREIPDGTQALLIRTTTKLNRQTYPTLPSSLQFAATASAGTDHVDIPWLESNGLTVADAAGCNARAVAEYVATVLLIWADVKQINFKNLSVGIIGVGNTGSKVQNLLTRLAMATAAYDPPRKEREAGFQSASLNDVLDCDILTFHTPLTRQTNQPTYYWLDESKLMNRRFKLIINAARGGVVDEMALLEACKNNRIDDYILDVWENEPAFNDKVASNAFIKTPHIAGYSVQAKHNASAMIANAFCEYFGLQTPANQSSHKKETVEIPASVSSISALLQYLHPVDEYNQMLSKLIGEPASIKKTNFNRIRTTHPLRYEYGSLCLPPAWFEQPSLSPLRGLFNS